MMTPKIVKSGVSRFSCSKLEAGRNVLGFCTAADESMSVVFSRPSVPSPANHHILGVDIYACKRAWHKPFP